MADWSDARMLAQVNDITAALLACGTVGSERGERAWLERYKWFSAAAARLVC